MHGTPCGDVNGDGLDDILINLGPGQTRPELGAFLVFGKSDEEPVDVAAIASGEPGSEALGRAIESGFPESSSFSVVPIGDINGDGLADLAALSQLDYQQPGDVSVIDVIYGEPALPRPMRPAEITAGDGGFRVESPPDTGASARGVGDMDGDGFDDLAIGYSNYDIDAHYFVYGDSEPLSPTVEELDAEIGGFSFRSEWLRQAGDVNGDGHDDFISLVFGSYYHGGTAHIVFGGPSFGPQALNSESAGATISFSSQRIVSAFDAGDVNDDGFDDVVLGGYQGDVAYVVFGGGDMVLYDTGEGDNGTADLGERGYVIQIGDPFSVSEVFARGEIVPAGDANGDGLDDIIIRGKDGTYLALGKKDTETLVLRDEGLSLDDLPLGKHLGRVSGVGSIRGNGSRDLLISDPDAKVRGEKQSGRVFVLFDPDLAD